VAWFHLFGGANPMRGGKWRLRLKLQYVQTVPIPDRSEADVVDMERLGKAVSNGATERAAVLIQYRNRVSDLFEDRRVPLAVSETLNGNFDDLRKYLNRHKVEIPVSERDEWERYFKARKTEVEALSAEVSDAEVEINDRVFRLFKLSRDETALIDDTIAGQY
jgi:hypothetical protein